MSTDQIQRVKLRYGIVGHCEALERALEIALKIAPVDLSVLVVGENGVGKEIFPRIIHDNSLRSGKKYFAVNCGAIPEGTIDSELFGHEKGAFTGAIERREGYFSVANGGTLFLDEVGELPLPTQARLLRVLETGEYIPVGASQVSRTDVRIVAATNRNLESAISEGRFRQDLYYRLNSVSIAVPPLRERGDDAVLLFRKFALEMSEKYSMPPVRLTPEAAGQLAAYPWPGNVRQLKNLAENMSVTAEQRDITPEVLAAYLPAEQSHSQIAVVSKPRSEHSFESEREILYQILFDLRRDVTELKKIVSDRGLAPHASATGGTGAQYGGKLFPVSSALPIDEAEEIKEIEELAAEIPSAATTATPPDSLHSAAAEVAAPAAAPTTGERSIEEVERDMIRATLLRTGGSRRASAQRLGISERTLYRKIKEYGLEDLR